MKKVAKGTALRQHVIPWRVVKAETRAGQYSLSERIPEIRKLLRTDRSVEDISRELDVCSATLRAFIKRRNICDLRERTKFIDRQRSIATLERREPDYEKNLGEVE